MKLGDWIVGEWAGDSRVPRLVRRRRGLDV